ncbi:hypothetical protein Tco_1307828 [Tanacetum coccineum]
MIDVYNVSHEEIPKDLFATNHPSGNPTSSLTSHTDLTSSEVNDDIFNPEGDIIKNFLNLDKTKDLPPYHDNPLILPFNAKSDLLELEYLLNHDPIKDMNSILEDSVDENSLDDNLDDTISEMFTDELAPSKSFPPGDNDMTLEDVIKEVKCLLTQSPLENYSLDNDLINTILEIFTDEHALDYSSPPLYDCRIDIP